MSDSIRIKRLVAWAAIECEKQRSGERSVSWMVDGWALAAQHQASEGEVTPEFIIKLGKTVEPRTNQNKWRQVGVQVGNNVKPQWHEVPRLMDNLIEAWNRISSDEWYREFEEVHPFRDGNGRTGNILWNYHRDTLEPRTLDFPPDFWGDKRLSLPTSLAPGITLEEAHMDLTPEEATAFDLAMRDEFREGLRGDR